MSSTHAPRPGSRRGLLAGLLALVVFASAAVAMTAGGSSGADVQIQAAGGPGDGDAERIAPGGGEDRGGGTGRHGPAVRDGRGR